MGAIVYGVDIGFCNTGVAVFEFKEKWELVDSFLIVTSRSDKKKGIRVADDDVSRVQHLTSELDKICEKYPPNLFVTELPHGGGQSSSAVKAMALASGCVATFTQLKRISGLWVTPRDVKIALTGKPAASKEECMEGAGAIFPEFKDKYSNEKKGKYFNYFEHIADATGAFLSAAEDQYIKLLETIK